MISEFIESHGGVVEDVHLESMNIEREELINGKMKGINILFFLLAMFFLPLAVHLAKEYNLTPIHLAQENPQYE